LSWFRLLTLTVPFGFGWGWAVCGGLCLIGTIGTFGKLSSAKRVSLDGKV